MTVNCAPTMFGHASWVIKTPTDCRQSWRNYWTPLYVNQIAIPSLPRLENKCQRSITDCWSSILGDLGGDRLQTVINEVVAGFIGNRASEILLATSWKWATMERQWLLAFHHGQSQRDVAVTVYIHHFDCFCTVKGSRILSGSSVYKIYCYCPGGCGGNMPYISAYRGCHIHVFGCVWSSATHIAEDATPTIVDALLTLIFKMG